MSIVPDGWQHEVAESLGLTGQRECIRYSAAGAARLNRAGRRYGQRWRATCVATVTTGGLGAGFHDPGDNWNHLVIAATISGRRWMFDTTAGQFHGSVCLTAAPVPRGWMRGGMPWTLQGITYTAVPDPAPYPGLMLAYQEGRDVGLAADLPIYPEFDLDRLLGLTPT